ncbi:MAG: phage holin family protein [Ahniella sp.]|nr:phage holin family protein [Ahniella sp.]
MSSTPELRHRADGSIGADIHSSTVRILRIIHLLRSAGGDLLNQAGLHGRLAELEWTIEKRRLADMLAAVVLAAAALLCMMIFAGVLVLALSWDTAYRTASIIGLIAVYAIALGLAWQRLAKRSAQGSNAFSATRAELEADLALLKHQL